MVNNENELISIIVPVYNADKYLKECIDSLVNQTYKNIEVLLIDDGSSDKSGAICDEYAERYSVIRVFHNENQGVSKTRTFGIQHAKGIYLMFTDSDDYWELEAVEKMYEQIKLHDADLALCGYMRFKNDDATYCDKRIVNEELVTVFESNKELANLFTRPYTSLAGVSIWAKMYKRDLILKHDVKFPEGINYEEDCVFNLQYYKYVKKAVVINEVFYHYRQLEVSLSKGYRADAFGFLVNGFRERKKFFYEIGYEEFIPKLEVIFLLVIMSTCKKIVCADISRKQKREAYLEIMKYDETQEVVITGAKSKKRLMRSVSRAMKEEKVNMVEVYMDLWLLKQKIKRKIKK